MNSLCFSVEKMIVTDSKYLAARIDHKASRKKTMKLFAKVEGITIIPGFIAVNNKGETTTLGRGGSDFTASLLANYLQAERLDIWTDVNGMLTASPKIVSSAYSLLCFK